MKQSIAAREARIRRAVVKASDGGERLLKSRQSPDSYMVVDVARNACVSNPDLSLVDLEAHYGLD